MDEAEEIDEVNEEEEAREIDDILGAPPKRFKANKRKPKDVNVLVSVPDLAVHPDDWQAQRSSIPYDRYEDELPELDEDSDSNSDSDAEASHEADLYDERGSQMGSSLGSSETDSESNSASHSDDEDEIDAALSLGEQQLVVASRAEKRSLGSASGGEIGDSRAQKRARSSDSSSAVSNDEDSDDVPEEPAPRGVPVDVPANMPANIMLWAVTRFMHNGGDPENEAAFRETMREMWSNYIADMLMQVPTGKEVVVSNRASGTGDGGSGEDEIYFASVLGDYDGQDCWMCEHGLGQFDRILSTHMHEMKMLFEMHIMLNHPRVVGNIIFAYYRDYVYIPMLKNGKKPPTWSKEMAQEHFCRHVRDVRVRLSMLDHKMTDSMELMYSNLFEPHESGDGRYQHKPEVLSGIHSTFDRWIKLQAQKPPLMLSYNPDLNIDAHGGSEIIRYANLKVVKGNN